jgi:predicted GNAT family acetyltransferase
VDNTLTVQPLGGERAREATAYLESNPIETVYMRSLINEHGVEDARNRGGFYACRGRRGRIRGLALIGDAILFAADDDDATAALASFARAQFPPRLIRGLRRAVETFWQTYSAQQYMPHTTAEEHLLVMSGPVATHRSVHGLRPATLEDLSLLLKINAGMLYAEGGRNPLESDAEGFARRLALRISRGRVWVLREGDSLIFKTDLLAETPEAVYIEGLYVAPESRGRGVGLRCLSHLSRALLERTTTVCLTVREDNRGARALYEKAGFRLYGEHTTVYLQREQQQQGAAA